MRKLKAACLVALGAMLGMVMVGTAGAGHEDVVASYTGCLKSGKLENVRAGNTPASRCVPPSVEVHFSAGDITAVLNGTGLEGGGTNGPATLGIAPSYRLPQTCTAGQVAEFDGTSAWACADDDGATYTAGTGLDLTGNEFSIQDLYQLPQDCGIGETPEFGVGITSLFEWHCTPNVDPSQSCPNGQFATGLASTGALTCAAAGGGGGALQVFSATQANPAGEGVPDDGVVHPYGSVNVPAGTYLLIANAHVEGGGNFDQFTTVHCNIYSGPNALLPDSVGGFRTFSSSVVASTAGGAFSFGCAADPGADGAGIHSAQIQAVKIG